jgi:predicted transcriptional regulator of viral defense system
MVSTKRGRISKPSCLYLYMRGQVRTVERVVARIAADQHGVVTRAQLLAAGVTPASIDRRVRKGVLHVHHRGIYRVGHRAPACEADYLAAVLACGEGAVLSGRSAGHLYGLLKRRPVRIQVTAPRERKVPGVCARRSRSMDSSDKRRHRGIPVTTVARTLVDLAADLRSGALVRACHEAGVLHDTTPEEVEAVLARHPTSAGSATLRRVLRGDVDITMSALERRFRTLLRREGLLLPQMNRIAGGRRVDCRWPERWLIVELDGYRYHRSRHAWEQDRRREREARARGDEFRRYTYGDVFEEPRMMLAELRALLLPS